MQFSLPYGIVIEFGDFHDDLSQARPARLVSSALYEEIVGRAPEKARDADAALDIGTEAATGAFADGVTSLLVSLTAQGYRLDTPEGIEALKTTVDAFANQL